MKLVVRASLLVLALSGCAGGVGEPPPLGRDDRFADQGAPGDVPGPIRPGTGGTPQTPPPPPPPPVDFGITPPDELALDGESITEGEFVLREATAYAYPPGLGPVVTPLLTSADPPIRRPVQIGSGSRNPLLQVPAGTVVLVLVGEFDAIVPNLPPAPYTLTAFGDFTVDQDFTVFLPMGTGDLIYQWTGCGTSVDLSDNQDAFCAIRNLDPSEFPSIIDDFDVPGVVSFPACPSARSNMQPHGTLRTRAPLSSGCGALTAAMGSDTPETRTVQLGASSGTFDFTYETFSQQDRIVVTYEGATLFDTGCVGADGTVPLAYSGTSTSVTISVTPNCNDPGATGTQWEFTVGCPR